MKLSKRSELAPFRVMQNFAEANARARAGHDIIHLSLGQPGVELPEKVRLRVAEKLKTAPLGYTDPSGLPALREKLAARYQAQYGVNIPASRIFITIGSSSAFILAMIAAFDENDEVAIATPHYPAYPSMMQALNVKPVFLEGTMQSRFQPNVEMLQNLPRLPQGLVTASPSNPAGTILHADEMKKLAAFSETHDVRLIADEIYHGITYGEAPRSMAEYAPHAVLINSFSKYFLMPGWRLGWAVIPEDMVARYEILLQHFFVSPPAISQYAALEVLDSEDDLKEVVKDYARNREFLLEALPKAGFKELAPAEGAFFIYADVSTLTDDSGAFCRQLMIETGVVAVPGTDFDAARGAGFVRFSFSNSHDNVREALRRLTDWMHKRNDKKIPA